MEIKENKPENIFAYLDKEDKTSEREDEKPSQGGEEENTLDESSNEDLHKQPRFQRVIKNWRETERKLLETMEHSDKLYQKVNELEQKLQTTNQPKEAPEYWSKAYESKEAADAAWQVMQKHDEEILERAKNLLKQEEEAKARAVEEETKAWEQHIQSELDDLDQAHPELNINDNSKLKQKLWKVLDEYSPKNADGTYTYIPFTKAYEILEKEEKLAKLPSSNARKQAASVSMARSSGNEMPTRSAESVRRGGFKSLPWRSRISENE